MPINNTYISAAIITLNEEKQIAECIKSLDWVDQIVIVDSLSQDKTKEIALSLGAEVIDQKFLGHVKQKQFAVDQCQHDWVICLDADERTPPSLKKEIIQLFQQTTPGALKNGYSVARRSFHMGRWIMHGGWYPDRNIRLFHRNRGKWGGVDPHDRVDVNGEVGVLKGALDHYVFRDLAHNIHTNNLYSTISADILYNEGKRLSLFELIFKPLGKFIETYIVKKGFLDGMPGFIISVGAAYSMFLKFAKLWEKHRVSPKT